MEQFSRTSLLLGDNSIDKLKKLTVAIFGLGGVGSYVAESLARTGIGTLILVDNDVIDKTNINRQLFAVHSTVGQSKVAVAKSRILDINPNAKVITHPIFYSKDSDKTMINACDYVVDAIDSVSSKIALVEECQKKNIPIISCMGTGNKLNPTLFEIADIFETSVCPLCRVMRHELKKRNISSLKVVYSKEIPYQESNKATSKLQPNSRPTPGSTPFVPAVAGLILASEVVNDLLKVK